MTAPATPPTVLVALERAEVTAAEAADPTAVPVAAPDAIAEAVDARD